MYIPLILSEEQLSPLTSKKKNLLTTRVIQKKIFSCSFLFFFHAVLLKNTRDVPEMQVQFLLTIHAI